MLYFLKWLLLFVVVVAHQRFFFQSSTAYYVTLEVTNQAGKTTSAITSPLVFDASKPTSGHVNEGSVYEEDVVWWGHVNHMEGNSYFILFF